MSDQTLRWGIEVMSDSELQRELEGIPTFGLLLTPETRERRQRRLHLLQEEAQRRGIRYGRSQDIEEEQQGVQTHRRSKQTAPGNPIKVEMMYSSKKSPTACYRNYAKRPHSASNPDPAMEKRSSAEKGTAGSGEPESCSSGSLPKKTRTAGKTTSKCNPEHEEEEEEVCNVFTHEMENLECGTCYLPFESQVYSCKNGHAVCASCWIDLGRKCPSCNESIGDFRCRVTEKILAGMTRPCRFKKHGCLETVRYTQARLHEEELCRYGTCHCPFDGCVYSGRLLYGHILDAHAPAAETFLSGSITVTLEKWEPFRVLLRSDGESVFFLLNGGDVLTGRSLVLVCVCPYPVEEDPDGVEAMYTMVVKGDEPGLLSQLTASGKVQFVRRLDGYNAKGFLFVPDTVWGSSGSVTVTVYL